MKTNSCCDTEDESAQANNDCCKDEGYIVQSQSDFVLAPEATFQPDNNEIQLFYSAIPAIFNSTTFTQPYIIANTLWRSPSIQNNIVATSVLRI